MLGIALLEAVSALHLPNGVGDRWVVVVDQSWGNASFSGHRRDANLGCLGVRTTALNAKHRQA